MEDESENIQHFHSARINWEIFLWLEKHAFNSYLTGKAEKYLTFIDLYCFYSLDILA